MLNYRSNPRIISSGSGGGGTASPYPTAMAYDHDADTLTLTMSSGGPVVATGIAAVGYDSGVPAATAASPRLHVDTDTGYIYHKDDVSGTGAGPYVYSQVVMPVSGEFEIVASVPAATSGSPEFIVNSADGKAYYLSDINGDGSVYVYEQITA